ncbi:DUF1289 domain-containing protein [Cupriavidus respiraculi]|uniref:DUF1289 domain-containing protein n=1 Tax=Cupriavidus respiraculi TaxID=195930 RepID=UPI001C975707|nr:DUF1289 domain-containing protein [Cupriavidus respiraculi]MBY4946316.1 DUF1289 domain-containing protein [Cupriavidus respiraculi]
MPADPDFLADLVADLTRGAAAAQHASPVPSPCRNICRMDANGYCEGCLRTLEEIAGWGTRADADKRAIWRALPARAAGTVQSPVDPSR